MTNTRPAAGAEYLTEDGFTLVRQDDGTWSDGDLVFQANEHGLPMGEDGTGLPGVLWGPLCSPAMQADAP